MRLFTIISCHIYTLSPGVYLQLCIFSYSCLNTSFNLDFAQPSPVIFYVVTAAYALSAHVSLSILCLKNDNSNGTSQNTSVKGTSPSGPSVSLHGQTARLKKNFLFNLYDPLEIFETYVLFVHYIFLLCLEQCVVVLQSFTIRNCGSRKVLQKHHEIVIHHQKLMFPAIQCKQLPIR